MALNKFKTTYILIAIFAILFLFVYFYEKDRVIVDENEIETHQVIQLNQENIKQIKFSYENKVTIVKKDDDKWQITKPIKYQARTQKIEEVIVELNNLESEQKFIAEKLSDYGLDDPTTQVKVTTNDDEQIEIILGNLNPQQDKVYLKTSLGDEIYLVDSTIESRLRLNDEVLKED